MVLRLVCLYIFIIMITILSYVFLALYLAGVLYTLGMFFHLMLGRNEGATPPPARHRRLIRFTRKVA